MGLYIQLAADDLLPRSAATIKTELKQGYNCKMELVKRALQNLLLFIHVMSDNWMPPNSQGVKGFMVQFVTEDHGL